MDNFKIGYKFTTLQGYEVKIVDIINSQRCVVEYENGFQLVGVEKKIIENRNVKYPFHPTVFGIGFIGVGKHNSTISTYVGTQKYTELNPAYKVWQAMLSRCYCPKTKMRKLNNRNATVHPKWLNYQNFARWFNENYIEGFEISKDFLIPNSTEFSEDTCCFLPSELRNSLMNLNNKNMVFMGVRPSGKKFNATCTTDNKRNYLGTFDTPEEAFLEFKKAKEERIRTLANIWEKFLPKKTYNALMNFKVIDYREIK